MRGNLTDLEKAVAQVAGQIYSRIRDTENEGKMMCDREAREKIINRSAREATLLVIEVLEMVRQRK